MLMVKINARLLHVIVGCMALLMCASAVLVSPAAPVQAEARPRVCGITSPPTPPPPQPCEVTVTNEHPDVYVQVILTYTQPYHDSYLRRSLTFYLAPFGQEGDNAEILNVVDVHSLRVTLAQPGQEGTWLLYQNVRTDFFPPFDGQDLTIQLDYNPEGYPYFEARYDEEGSEDE